MGTASAAHGIITECTTSFRTGFVVLLIGLAGMLDARIRINTARLVEHATTVGRISMSERQSFAEMGWKAALLSVDQKPPANGGAEIHEFPAGRRPSEMRRDGSA
ncbi:hypothetical protein [Streptomyces sp. NPDC002386]